MRATSSMRLGEEETWASVKTKERAAGFLTGVASFCLAIAAEASECDFCVERHFVWCLVWGR